jgi:hypothetical protein
MNKSLKKHFDAVGIVGGIQYLLVIVMMLCAVVWSMESDPLTVNKTTEDKKAVAMKPGNVVEFSREVCTTKPVTASVQRFIKNVETGKKHDITNALYSAEVGCEEITYSFAIPLSALPGTYLYQPIIEYSINPMRNIRKELPSMRFIVE